MSPTAIAAGFIAVSISVPFLGLLVCAVAPLVEAAAHVTRWADQ